MPRRLPMLEAALDGMRFERPAYFSGEVALRLRGAALRRIGRGRNRRRLHVDRAVFAPASQSWQGSDAADRRRRRRPAGRFPAFPAEACDRRLRALRALIGVEICHAERQGDAPASLAEAHRRSTERSRRTRRARYGAGLCAAGDRTCRDRHRRDDRRHAAVDRGLPRLRRFHPGAADLEPQRPGRNRSTRSFAKRIDRAILGYRYWMDEPGNDVQWYFSENHALLFHTAAYLAGTLLPDATFRRSGRSGAEQAAVGATRVRAWLDHFEQWEMAEFNSAPYFPIDLKGLTALFALAPRRRHQRARRQGDRPAGSKSSPARRITAW